MDAHEFGSSMRLLHVLPITIILELARNKPVTLTVFPNVLSSQLGLGSCEHLVSTRTTRLRRPRGVGGKIGAPFWEYLAVVGQKLVRTCQAELKPIDQGSRFDAESEKLCAVAGTRAVVVLCFPSFNCTGFTYGM